MSRSLFIALATSTAMLATLGLAGCGSASQSAVPAALYTAEEKAAETARLYVFLDEAYDAVVMRSPIQQTFLGIKTDYDKWDDVTDARAEENMMIFRESVAVMRAEFNYDKLDAQGQLSFRLYENALAQAEAAFAFRGNSYVFNQMFGQQSSIPAFLINQHRVTSEADARAYIARLVGVEAYLGQHVANARMRAEAGVRPPRFVYDYVISDARNVITGYPFGNATAETPSPLFADISSKIDALVARQIISPETGADLKAEAVAALTAAVGPAFTGLIDFMTADLANATDDDGVWKLPDGQAYYAERLSTQTTTTMTPEEIHDLGLREVARIHGEMEAIKAKVGFEGSLQDFFVYMRTAPEFYYPNTDEGRARYLSEATALIDTMATRLPEVFGVFPKAELEVKAVEAFREKSAGKAFYQRPAPDGSRPGIYYANLYDMNSMPTYQMEALAYHEGIPGHHMQIAIAQEMDNLPKFRKFGSYTVYSEGWGLYTEYLPKEMGFYSDPYSDLGRLAMELWRAARLVVDTGLHDKKWTRQEAIQYLIDNTPNPEADCRKAIERYIVMPGQATTYMIGKIKILELRERARAELGEAFDIRAFHDLVLGSGAVPLNVLEDNVNAWIAQTKAA